METLTKEGEELELAKHVETMTKEDEELAKLILEGDGATEGGPGADEDAEDKEKPEEGQISFIQARILFFLLRPISS